MEKNSNLYVSFQLLIMRWGGRAAMRSPAEMVESEYIGVRIPSPPSIIFKAKFLNYETTWYKFPSKPVHKLKWLFF